MAHHMGLRNIQDNVILPIHLLVIVLLQYTLSVPVDSDKVFKLEHNDAKDPNQLDEAPWRHFRGFNDNSLDRDKSTLKYAEHTTNLDETVNYEDFLFEFRQLYSNRSHFVDKIGCYMCKAITWVLQQTLRHNEDRFAEIVVTICIDMRIEQTDICHGIVKVFKNEVMTMLDMLALEPDEACGYIMGSQCADFYNPYQMWNVDLPDPPTKHEPSHAEAQHKGPSLRVLHMADIHVDMKYEVNASVDCGRPLCCRNTSGPVTKSKAGQWGSYGYCDIPSWTLEHLFKHLSHNDKFDYIIWTGDLSSHDVWAQSRDKVLHMVDYLTNLFITYFPDTPVYWSLGNHESVPVNGFPPPYVKGEQSISWLYQHLAKVWAHWLPLSTQENITRGGFFSVEVHPGYRLVSLNMNYCNNENWYMLFNTTDPTGELQWFVSILHQAELVGEKVQVIGHIPPGKESCMKAWSWNYYKIITRFASTVTGQFFSHTHTDSLTIFYDVDTLKRPLAVAYVAPSVTTYIGMNPSYRVYTMDGFYNGSSWSVLDHETHILNLNEANKQRNPQWRLEYTAKSAYNLSDLTPASWQTFSETLLEDKEMMLLYYKHYYKSSQLYPSCDRNCTTSHVCEIRTGRSHDPNLCQDLDLARGVFQQWLLDNTMC